MTNADDIPPSSPVKIVHRVIVENSGEQVTFLARQDQALPRPRLIKKRDIRTTLYLLITMLIVAILPRSIWEGAPLLLFHRRLARRRQKKLAGFAHRLGQVFGPAHVATADALFRAKQVAQTRVAIAIVAGLVSRRWRPDIRLHGAAGLQQALDRGHGAIIWCHQFTAQNLFGKRALHEAGFSVHQVSSTAHGFSETAYARQFLNPFLLRQENAYLASRVVFDRNETREVTRRIQSILRANGVVLITNNTYAGSVFIELPFGHSDHLRLASTPLNFALSMKAALFSMETFETIPLEKYDAIIMPEISVSRMGTESRYEALTRAALIVRDQLFEGVKKYPEQFLLW